MKESYKYSQNNFRSKSLIKRLLDESNIEETDTVLDIGTGTGQIADVLLEKGCKVIGVEPDLKLFLELKNRYQGKDKIKIIGKEFAEVDLPKNKYKVFSNIPFISTADIIRKLTNSQLMPESIYTTMQEEASDMYLGLNNESLKSLLIKAVYEINILYKFHTFDFTPIPRVKIVFVEFIRRNTPLLESFSDIPKFRDFVSFVFLQYAKDISQALKKIVYGRKQHEIFKKLDINPAMKRTELDLDQWIGLYNETKNRFNIYQLTYIKYLKDQEKAEKKHRTTIKY